MHASCAPVPGLHQDLLLERGPAYDTNLEVFYSLQRTITGWPGKAQGQAAPRCALLLTQRPCLLRCCPARQ